MKIYFDYGKKAVALPALKKSLLLRAGRTEMRLLMLLAADSELAEHYEEKADGLAAELKTTRSALDSALGFWIGAGILVKDMGSENERKETRGTPEHAREAAELATPPKRSKVTELPVYTSDELSAVLERRGELATLIEEAQGILGKVFNTTEVQLLVGISEGLGLEDEYILNLLAYCKKIDKANMRYVEKIAISLYDKGIKKTAQLEEYIKELDRLASAEGKIRKIFGMGERAFTTKESGFVEAWLNRYGFDFEMIRLAYEDTVNNTSKPSMSYANKVLETWFSEGLKTPEEVAAAKAKRQGGGKGGAQAASFNVDDFFNAAINRGFDSDSDKKGE